jgi:SOS response regulatory protein OraA/RecX
VNEIYIYALRLLKKRDYTVSELSKKLEGNFHTIPAGLIDQLTDKNFLSDRRFAENYVRKRIDRGPRALRDELLARGVAEDLVNEILGRAEWPSLREVLTAKMNDWKLRAPLQSRDAARLFRVLVRLGYDEDTIREEIEQKNEQ